MSKLEEQREEEKAQPKDKGINVEEAKVSCCSCKSKAAA